VSASAQDLVHINMRLGWSCHVSACVCKHQGLVDVSAYNGWYQHTLRAERLSAFIGRFLAFIKSCAFICICWPVWRGVRLFACVAHVKSWACIFICRQVSRAHNVSRCVSARIERARHVSACVCTFGELGMFQHVQ
jgi:hypothetical protein